MSHFHVPIYRVIIPAVMADRKPAALHLFRNYSAPYDEHYLTRDTRFPRPKKAEGECYYVGLFRGVGGSLFHTKLGS